MYYKSTAVLHHAWRGHPFKELSTAIHRHAEFLDGLITAAVETGLAGIVLGLVCGFILMLHALNLAYYAFAHSVGQMIPIVAESVSTCSWAL